jgi:hypothetical protein
MLPSLGARGVCATDDPVHDAHNAWTEATNAVRRARRAYLSHAQVLARPETRPERVEPPDKFARRRARFDQVRERDLVAIHGHDAQALRAAHG